MADTGQRLALWLLNGLAGPGLLFVLLLRAASALAGGVTLAWDPVNSPLLAGYMVYYGPAAGNYTSGIDVGNTTSFTVSGLVEGATYHFASTAYDATHTQSGFSNDVAATISNGAPVASLTASPASIGSGGTLNASWSGIATPSSTDWVGLFVPGAPATNNLAWTFVSCTQAPGASHASGSCPFTLPNVAPGTYELRLFSNNSHTTLAISNTFAVTTSQPTSPQPTSLTASPASIGSGGTVNASWSGIATPSSTDWVGLFVPGAPATSSLAWIYVSCTQTPGASLAGGSCPFTIPNVAPGTYELRLFSNNSHTTLAASNTFAVTTSQSTSLTASPASIGTGGTLNASWSGIASPSPTDWVGLFIPGAPATYSLAWIFVNCTQTPGVSLGAGSCPFTIPNVAPGTYELRLFSNNSHTTLATSNTFAVISLVASPGSIGSGGTLNASWSGIPSPSPTDWVGLFIPGAPATYSLAWIYVDCTQTPGASYAAGACPFTLPNIAPGTYELRLFSSDSHTTLATSNTVIVTP